MKDKHQTSRAGDRGRKAKLKKGVVSGCKMESDSTILCKFT